MPEKTVAEFIAAANQLRATYSGFTDHARQQLTQLADNTRHSTTEDARLAVERIAKKQRTVDTLTNAIQAAEEGGLEAVHQFLVSELIAALTYPTAAEREGTEVAARFIQHRI